MKTGETGGGGHASQAKYLKGLNDGRSHMGKPNALGPKPEVMEGPKKVGGGVHKLRRRQTRG